METTNLSAFLLNSTTLEIPLTWDGAAFTPGSEWALIFTAKYRESDRDIDAVFQKASGAGITASGSTASVSMVPDDTTDVQPVTLLCDVHAQSSITNEVRTVAFVRLELSQPITRETTTSVPVVTTEEPLPFGGGSWNDLTGTANHIPFDTTPTDVPATIGTLSWNADDACLEYAVTGGTISVGKETFDYYTNLSGVPMVDGDIVSIVGASGNRTAVDLADATDDTSAANVIGMVTNGAANNQTVRVTKSGSVHSLNTNGITEGATIYVDPNNPGKWTTTKPSSPNHVVSIGFVQVAHSTNGVVDVVPNHQCVTASLITDSSAAGRAMLTAATASAQADLLASVSVFAGSYASDLAAHRAGVRLYGAYRKTDKAVVWRDSVTEQIALMGDSITAQGSTGNHTMTAVGYGTWARIFGASQWDAALNGSVLEFATGGYTSAQVESTHLPEVLASNATRCVIACGINDYSAGQTSAQTATRLRGMWATLAAAGITPIATTITPDAATAARQSWIAATNILIRSHATADGVTLCDWAPSIEVSPGVGSTIYTPDNIHPNSLGASKLGRTLAATIAAMSGLDARNNYASTSWLTANSALAGSSGQPTDWAAPTIASGATLNSKSLVSSSNGNWWRLDHSTGTATSRSSISNMAANLSTVVGKTVEGILELQVISGGLRGVQFRAVTTGGTQESYDCQGGDNIATADLITAADGIVILRTPQTVVSSGVTLLWPQIQFSGTAVFQIRRAGIRQA